MGKNWFSAENNFQTAAYNTVAVCYFSADTSAFGESVKPASETKASLELPEKAVLGTIVLLFSMKNLSIPFSIFTSEEVSSTEAVAVLLLNHTADEDCVFSFSGSSHSQPKERRETDFSGYRLLAVSSTVIAGVSV